MLHVLATAWLFAALPVAAREVSLAHDACVGGAEKASDALLLEVSELQCGENSLRFRNRAEFVRSHISFPDQHAPFAEPMVWQTDPALFDSMLLLFTYADNSRRLVDVDPQMAARNWFVRSRFSVPIPEAKSTLVSVDAVVERPRTHGILKDARLTSEKSASREHYVRSIFYALACGLLLVPIFFDLMFFGLLRFRFILWHGAMTVSHLIFIFSNSGLIFELFPGTQLAVRFQLNTLSLASSMVFAVLFVIDLLEEGTVSKRLRHTLLSLTGIMLALKAVTLLDLDFFRMSAHALFLISLIPIIVLILVASLKAFKKGSHAAVYLLVAFTGVVLSGILKILIDVDILSPIFPLDDLVFISMVLLVLSTSAATGDRFLALRVERDRARMDAIKLGRMALTDPLTGLANRRAFDQVAIIKDGQALLIGDIDHFKTINDRYGHATGDAVLSHLSNLLRGTFRNTPRSTVYRLGGEEFAVILPCEDAQALRNLAEQFRETVNQGCRDAARSIPSITLSVGGALGRGRKVEEVFLEADQALYRAKQGGRNRSAVNNEHRGPVASDGKRLTAS